ncbi:MAG TPA: 6-bladed beta-propeller [Gemmatimonadaceae bacterium]|nr:6-bladed beta-propeller [Gemmatimonadaceae bacterium]
MQKPTMVALAGFLGAFAAGAQRVPPPAVHDSAGVRIVEHRTIKNAPVAFTIAVAPQIDLGGLKDDPITELSSKNPFANATRLSDGRYVASDYSSIKVFDAKGKYIRTIGRAGDGPGEFHQLREVCVATGDTLIAIGYGDRRISVFDSAGRHVRSFTAPGYATEKPCFADGSTLAHANPRVNPETSMPAERAATLDRIEDLAHVRSDGSGAGTIGWSHTQVFAGAQTINNSIASGRSVYVGDGRTAEIRIYSIDGKLTQIIRWGDPLTPITDEDAQRTVEPMRGGGRGSMPPRPHLAFVPAYAHLLADEAGRVWVQDYFLSSEPRGWTVFSSDGSLAGRVFLPRLAGANLTGIFELVSVHRDYVVLKWYDTENGAMHLSLHSLQVAR